MVRLVVLNFNGGALTTRCLDHLQQLEWPPERLQIVVVDNDSTDGSVAEIERRFPSVEIRRNTVNGGFPANNLALRDLEGIDYVGLINNDAFAEPGWLAPLVSALSADAGLGAVSSKLVLAPRFVEVRISSPTFVPGPGDPRQLGVMVRDVLAGDVSVRRQAHFGEGGWGAEHDRDGMFEWTRGSAVLRVPVDDASGRRTVTLRLQAERTKEIEIDGGSGVLVAVVGHRTAEIEVPVAGEPFDVLNNVGSVVFVDGAGADRGWLERDAGQYDEPAEVFAWCGGSVLFRPAYLADAGLFDEHFFLYYEDTDLSWRGRALGWRYRTVPTSMARHVHAATSEEGSSVFAHYVERNRLLMLVKNAPRRMALGQLWRFLLVTASYARRDLIGPVLRGRRPRPEQVRRRTSSFVGVVRLLVPMMRQRRIQRRRQVVPDRELTGWFVSR